jgi:hypothetical protein
VIFVIIGNRPKQLPLAMFASKEENKAGQLDSVEVNKWAITLRNRN